MTEKPPLHEGLQKGQIKYPVRDGSVKPAPTQPAQSVQPPPKPAPLPQKK